MGLNDAFSLGSKVTLQISAFDFSRAFNVMKCIENMRENSKLCEWRICIVESVEVRGCGPVEKQTLAPANFSVGRVMYINGSGVFAYTDELCLNGDDSLAPSA